MATKSLTFDIFGRDKTASKAIEGVGRAASGLGLKMVKVGAAIGAAFIAAGIAKWAKESVDALKEWETIQAQTNAVVKSTGGVAQVTAKQVHELAQSIEAQTATSAESVQKGANLLLTFKNIRNEAGEGNDIFDQTTRIMVDMARAMGTDADAAAIQLGKALNDPIAGISALSRVGVQFTDDQKKMIEQLVLAGDTMGAQKIILQELTDQFGGSGAAYADTFAGKMFLLEDAIGDVGEKLMLSLMPLLEGLVTLLNEDGVPAFDSFVTWIIDNVVPALSDFSYWVGEELQPVLTAIGDWFNEKGGPALDAFAMKINDELVPAMESAEGGASDWSKILDGLGWVILNIVVPILTWLATRVTYVLDTFHNVADFLNGDSSPEDYVARMQKIGGPVWDMASGIFSFVVSVINSIIALANAPIDAINGVIGAVNNLLGTSIPKINRIASVAAQLGSKAGIGGGSTGSGSAGGGGGGGGGSRKTASRFAAHGGTFDEARWVIVGERGPERLFLPGGSRVEPNGSNAVAVHNHFSPGTEWLAQFVQQEIEYADGTKAMVTRGRVVR